MNLENLNLVELNAQEVQEVEGGILLELFIPGLIIPAIFGLGIYNGYHSH